MSPIDHDDPLDETLRYSMAESKFEKTPYEFLPQGVLNDLKSPSGRGLIMKAIGTTQPTVEDDALVKFIWREALVVFTTMAYIEADKKLLRMAMSWFHKENFDDSKLPVDKWPGPTFRNNKMRGILHPFESMEDSVAHGHAKFWTSSKIIDFQNAQVHFLAPVFSTDKTNHDAWDRVIPFVAHEVTYAEGSFGMVSKYEIHRDHIQDSLGSNGPPSHVFAVKEIKVDNKDRQRVARNWASEVKAMELMNKLDHKGHIVRFITAFRRGSPKNPEHYLITEWADGGNLHDLWKTTPKPQLTASRVQEVITQLLGLAEALNAAHYLYDDDGVYSGASYRHGDLKPENILWFTENGKLGTLKICDWGCAKNKKLMTVVRHSKSLSYGTRRYEPPEVETGVGSMLPGTQEKRKSRLYDLWSMGVITLEFIVWLLYGVEGLEKFNKSVGGDMNEGSPFYQLIEVEGEMAAQVHNVATYWMDYMAQDPACRFGTTALGDLLEIVQEGLMVVKLPQRGGTFAPNLHKQLGGPISGGVSNDSVPGDDMEPQFPTAGPERLRADQLRDRLEHIVLADEGESYWSTIPEQPLPDVPEHLYLDRFAPDVLRRPVRDQVDYGHPKLDPTDWTFETDNDFAAEVFSAFKDIEQYTIPEIHTSSNLCDQCKSFRNSLWDVFFEITYDLQCLRNMAETEKCDLCGLLWRTCQRKRGVMFEKVRFEKSGSSLKMNGGQLPVLSIARSFDCKSAAAAELQIGFAELPEAGSLTHFEVVRRWLTDCDQNHSTPKCKPAQRDSGAAAGSSARLPTRLIDVGIGGDEMVRLWETESKDFVLQDTEGWLALSHQWGPPPHFSTTSENVDEHLARLDLAQLPATFKDAVLVTRALGRRYLWIDSICIIQAGAKADFKQEGKRMEDVYSGAYCVIAATRAAGHESGFLRPRPQRDYVAFRRDADNEAPFFVSQRIDNFKEHVLDGALSKRGWVLQEHALARRTIFFADHQTYWECGHGVRCETMTRLRNESAQLLGDPNFPQILDSATHGEKILRYQELYQIYSRLGLSRASDRPRAIDGLEQRLLRTMNVDGGFGMFDAVSTKSLLRRSLLWHRGSDTPSLTRIPGIAVPSWSWMAYSGGKDTNGREYPGGINYFKPKNRGFDWEDFESPWSRSQSGETRNTLTAKVRDFDQTAARPREDCLMFDTPADTDRRNAKCVVMGIQKGNLDLDDKRNFVLVVVPTDRSANSNNRVYRRVGAGYLPGRCFTGDAVLARIQ